MNESESTKNEDANTKLLTIKKDEDGNFHSDPIKLDDGTQVEFFTERQDDQITKTQIFRELQFVEEELCETHNLTNHADTVDYAVSVGCGIICGIIHSVFVGKFELPSTDKPVKPVNIDELTKKLAKLCGYKNRGGDETELEGSIRKLEQKFPVSQDSVYSGKGIGVSHKSHHLDDLAHHSSIVGLIAAIFAEYLRMGFFINKEGKTNVVFIQTNKRDLLKIWLPIIISGLLKWLISMTENISEEENFDLPDFIKDIDIVKHLSKSPALISILKTSGNWVGHLMSDINGSSSTAGAGMGIPGLYLSFLKEVSSLPMLNNSGLSEYIDDLYRKQRFDMRKELALFDQLGKQAIPVLVGEILVRGFYLIRHLIDEYQKQNSFHGINWHNVVPVGNRTIVRMLTISKGTFEIFNVTDTAIRSKGFTNPSFLLHLNFAGAASFGISIAIDFKMGIKKHKLERAYGCPKNIDLIRLYKKNAGNLSKLFNAMPEFRNYKGPLFLHLDEKQYEKTPIKIMFVSVQHPLSLSYNEGMKQPKKLLSLFEEYKKYRFPLSDSFGNFAKKITASLNKDYSNQAVFIWNSVYKFSHTNKGERNAENESLRLLKDEIKICNPYAVIFMTGSKYDNDILKHFDNDDSFQKTCIDSGNKKLPDLSKKSFAKLIHKDKKLPEHMYRISDPHSLCFKLFKARSVQYWLERLILGIAPEETEKTSRHISVPWKKILKALGILLLIILLLLVLRTCKGCTPDEKSRKDKVSVAAMQETKQPVSQPPTVTVENAETLSSPKAELKETKSFTFRADRRDFVNPEEAEQWFDATAKEIKNLLQQRPSLKFKICGYVAEFDNEIDGMVLSQERADNIKKGLVKRGIPAEKLITIPMGKTVRWGKERKSNRAATIESFEE